jgi:hypothetical protein
MVWRLEIPAIFWMAERFEPAHRPSPDKSFGAVSAAMEWSSRIMAVSAEMVLPGLVGWWLDGKTGWNVFTAAGFALGLIVGVTHLIAMTRPLANKSRKTGKVA